MTDERPSQHITGLPGPVAELPWSDDFVMQAIEVLPVRLRDGAPVSLKPAHADSFIVGWPARAKPEEVAAEAIESLGMRPLILHSTSWRHTADEVVLTYVAVVPPDAALPESWQESPVHHAELARGGATTPPPVIGVSQVLEHALRHLAWLMRDDELIAHELPEWHSALKSYVPEPFRALSEPGDLR